MTNDKSRRRPAIFDWLVGVLILALLGYVYVGFFFFDPRIGTMVKILLWGVRITLPLIGVGVVLLYFGVRAKRIPASAVALLILSVIVVALVAYPIAANLYYGRSFRQNIDQYHPYLQLSPHDFRPQADSAHTRAFRIFCLGGSTTEYRDKNGRGWTERLQERLQGAIPGRTIEVYNLGRQWYTTQHALINYSVTLRQHRPDMIIVMEAINDLLHNADFCAYSFGPFREDYRHFYGPVYRLIRRPTLEETVLRVLRSMWYHQPREVIDTDTFPGLAPFTRNLRTLIDLARTDSTRVVLMTQPNLFKDSLTAEEDAALIMLHVEAVGPRKEWSVATARRGMEQYNDAVRRVAAETGSVLIDLERAMPKTLEYLHDDVHYRDKGFDLVADTVAAYLHEPGMLR